MRILLILIVGWGVGYWHHFTVTHDEVLALERNLDRATDEVLHLQSATRIVKKVKVKATAYSNDPGSINVERWQDGLTATGSRARRGYVAADWRVFPPGTRLYIPGYGEAVVKDRGGAVEGLHIDVFMDTREEALRWGVQTIDVVVIEEAVGATPSLG
jgi:3D (Asp-Asp-Asp) domain-containing protein